MSVTTNKPRWITPSIDVTITVDNYIEEQIRKLILRLKPKWKKDSLKIEKLSGGILNLMYCCTLKSTESVDVGESIIVRIHQRFGDMADNEMFDPKKEIDTLEKIMSTNLGPKLIVIFNNGLCYKFLPGETLNCRTVRSEKFIPRVTEAIARLHSLPLMEKETGWSLKEGLEDPPEYPLTFEDPARLKRVLEFLPDRETYIKEMNYLAKILPTLKSPRVFCHNDTKGENLIWNETEGTLKLIDFEHAGNNFQAFEIGHHFASYNDVMGSTPDTYPDRAFQLRWITQYLEYWYKFTGRNPSDVTNKDVERLFVQSNKFAQMSRLIIGVALLKEHDERTSDCFEFCMNNIKDYFKFKDEVNAMVLPE